LIGVIDYDIGNIMAVVNMFQRLGQGCKLIRNAEDFEQVDRFILPGNGAFDSCMLNLHKSGLIPFLEKEVLQLGKPLLGICVGAQMLGLSSAEGEESGLGWLDMQTERFPELPNLRVPHMGWNSVVPVNNEHLLIQNIKSDTRFYFIHSYYMKPKNSSDILLTAHYGIDFTAGVAHGNIMGVQFHPEKSHRFGKDLLASYSEWSR
jgi:glutamine amidotransferase